MKKLLSLVLAILFVLSLVGCGSKDTPADDTPATTPGPASDTPADPDAADDLAKFQAKNGFALTPESLQSDGTPYKVAYISFSWDNTVEHMANAMGRALEGFGCEFTALSSEGNPDTFIQNIENYISQGYDGIFANVYSVTTGRASEILNESGITWMPATQPAYDYDDNIVTPYVAVDDAYVGKRLTDEALAWAEENWEDFNIEDCYIYIIDVSTATELHNRCLAMEEEAKAVAGDAYKIEIADSISEGGGFSPEVAYNMCVRTFAANPDVKHWIVLHPFDYYASGTCRAAEDYNIVDNVCTATCNGDNYLPILQDGTSGAWRFCLDWDNGLWGYLYGCGMYAMLSGACTPEQLWNDYIPEGETYAGLQMDSLVVGPDNYKNVLGFYDNLIGDNDFGYKDAWDGTEYPILYAVK